MLKKIGIVLFAVLLVSFVIAPCGAAELVQNGGFETGDFSSWTTALASSGSDLAVGSLSSSPSVTPHTGTYAASFGAFGTQDDSISQTLATVAGQSYTFSFWLDHPFGRSTNDFSASWGGTSLIGGAIPALPLTDSRLFPYTQYTFTEIAGPSPTVITFSGLEVPEYFYLDDVSVTGPQAVPEPLSLFLFGAGLVGMTVIKRKDRKEEA
jgi:hypothetical protein